MTNSKKENFQIVFFSSALILAILFALLYIYFLNQAVIGMVKVKESLSGLEELKKEYRFLEEEYFAKTKNLNLDYAHSLGFADLTSPLFALRKTEVAKLNLPAEKH